MKNNQNQQVVSSIIVFNKKLLLLLRDNSPGIRDPECWQLPGGVVEGNETISEAIRRELLEEIGITPKNINYLTNPYPNIHIFYIPLTEKETTKIKKGDEGTDLRFFSLDEIANIPLTQKLQHTIKNQKELLDSLLS
ncbi:MAG: NUDIX domain-containing protein [bacterium]